MKFIPKDIQRRYSVYNGQIKRKTLKSIIYNENMPNQIRSKARIQLNATQKDASKVRVVNRCILTGRSYGVYSQFRLSRLMLKQWVSYGLLPGIRKSSF